MKANFPINNDGKESTEHQPLVPRHEGIGGADGDKETTLIDWVDIEKGNCLVTGQEKQWSWRPSSPISSALCSCAWWSRKFSSHRSKKDAQGIFIKVLKNVASLGLLGFSIYLVMAAILTKQTKVAQAAGPAAAALSMWGLIIWLGLMEGGQGSLVGLQPVDKALYEKSHPIAYQCARIAHHGDNLNRFILGRQFLVFLVVFIVNTCSSPIPNTSIPGVPNFLMEAILESGLATIIITVILGQLAAEVNATKSMFDFINNAGMLLTLWISLAIEMSGILHSVYLVQYFFGWVTGKSVTNGEESSRGILGNLFFWSRVLMSTVVLGYACIFTFVALMNGQTDMFDGVPSAVSLVTVLILTCLVGMMEAMQIALFAVVNLPEEELNSHPVARANCQWTFSGNNFQAFLIGRQVCVTLCLFILARMITIDVDITPLPDGSPAPTVMGVSEGVQDFLNTGLPGALITTIVSSLAWRIVASSFPIAFMSNPLVALSIHLCLFLESTGLFSSAWLCAEAHRRMAGFRPDEQFVGKPLGGKEEDETSEGDTEEDTDSECTDEMASVRLSRDSTGSLEYGSSMSLSV